MLLYANGHNKDYLGLEPRSTSSSIIQLLSCVLYIVELQDDLELRSCVNVEVAVLGSPPLIVLTVSME